MGFDVFRRGFVIKGKKLTIGGDVDIIRQSANVMGVGAADSISLAGSAARLLIPNSIGTTMGTPALVTDGQIVMVSNTVGQIPKLFCRQNGTTYWFNAAGSA